MSNQPSIPAEVSPTRSRSRLRGLLRRLLAVIFGLLMAWLALEFFMRVGFELLPAKVQGDIQGVLRVPWSDQRIIPPLPLTADHDFQERLDPGLQNFPVHWSDAKFTFNTISAWDGHRAGLRSSAPRWPLDILTIGDSYTFCWTKWEDCWVHRLETDYDWHVFNAGIPGTGSAGQLNLMKEIAPPLKPKLVVWEWYNNDISDDYDLARIRGEVGDLRGAPEADPVPDLTGLARYSALVALIQNALTPQKQTTGYQHYMTVPLNGRPVLVHTNEYMYATNISYPRALFGWQSNIKAHDEAAKLLKDQGTEMLLIVIPTKEEAYGEQMAKYVGQYYLNDMSESRRMLLDLCAARGWHCIDPMPAFQDAIRNGQTLYYAFDQHLDPSGNLILEKLVHDYILHHNLIGRQ